VIEAPPELLKFRNFDWDGRHPKLGFHPTSRAVVPTTHTMGNQHSAPDKDKERERDKDKPAEKEKDKNQDPIRPNPRHEKHRSRTITASPLPPTETKVNAEQTPNNNGPNPTAPEPNQPPAAETPTKPSGQSVSAPTSPSVQTTPVKERAMAKTIAAKDVVEGVKNIKLEYLPKPANEEEIKKEAAEMEPTPKFETMRASSQTSIVDEEELKEADKSGIIAHTWKNIE